VPASALWIGDGTGLTGAYYNNTSHAGPPVLVRTDPQVDFDFASGSPDPAVSADNFSVRWAGQILAPITGDVTFATNSDDGVRLRVNGQLVIDNWSFHGDTLNTSAPVHVIAGQKYDISLEFFEGGSAAVIRLKWSYPGQPLQAIPTTQLYLANVIEGVVRDGAVGRSGLRVQLFADGALVAEQVTDAQGRYRFAGLPFKDYRVTVFDPIQNRPATYAVTLTPGGHLILATPLADLGHTGVVHLHGRSDPSGTPAAGAVLSLSTEALPDWRREVTLDAEGNAAVSGLPAGDFQVESGAPPNYGWQDFAIAGGKTVDVGLIVGNRDRFDVTFPVTQGTTFVVDGQGAVVHSGDACKPYCGPFAKVNGVASRGGPTLSGCRSIPSIPRSSERPRPESGSCPAWR
jgi:hypothetical protein